MVVFNQKILFILIIFLSEMKLSTKLPLPLHPQHLQLPQQPPPQRVDHPDLHAEDHITDMTITMMMTIIIRGIGMNMTMKKG